MSATIDQQFIEYIVKTLVGNPDKVRVERTIDERGVLLELYVEPEDLGRVIGRNGTTAKSIRTLLRALGVKNDARYNLKIVDTGDGAGRPPREERAQEDKQEQVKQAEEVSQTVADEPADDTTSDVTDEVVDAPVEEGQSDIDRHRQDLKDLTDLDI